MNNLPMELTKTCTICNTEMYYQYGYKWIHLSKSLDDMCTIIAEHDLAIECKDACLSLGGIHRSSFLGSGEAAPDSN